MKLNLRRFNPPESNILAGVIVFTLVCFLAVPAAPAGIVSFSGGTPLPGPPATGVHPGDQPALPTPIIFPEFINGAILAGGVPVDHNGSVVVAAPVESAGVVNPLLVKSIIPAGTKVDSYLFHFDPAN